MFNIHFKVQIRLLLAVMTHANNSFGYLVRHVAIGNMRYKVWFISI